MKLIWWLTTVGVLLSGPTALKAALANAIQAVVHDSVITYHEVNQLTDQTADVVKARYRGQPLALEQELNKLRAENLDRQVQSQLILREFTTAGYNLPESTLDEIVQEHLKSDFGDRATATKSLEARGMTIEKYRRQVRDRFIIQQLRLKNISQQIIISPQKIETYYLAHREEYKLEDQVELRMIMLNKKGNNNATQARQMGEEILAKLKEGAPFAEMASIYSQGSHRAQGGDRGWVDRKVFVEELTKVAFSLKPGEFSGVIETEDACYLLLVEDTRPAHYKSLSEMREQIDRDLLQEERARIEKQWLDRLRKKTFVRYY